MVEFVFPSQQKGWIDGVRGKVVAARKWSETHVNSSGGGGYVHPQHGGHVSAPTISSRVVERGEIWVQTTDGKEVLVPLNLPANDGHELVVLWGNLGSLTSGTYMYWRNFTSERHGFLHSTNDSLLLTGSEQLTRMAVALAWWATTVAWLIDLFSNSAGMMKGPLLLVLTIAWGVASFLMLFRPPPRGERTKQLQQDLERLACRSDLRLRG